MALSYVIRAISALGGFTAVSVSQPERGTARGAGQVQGRHLNVVWRGEGAALETALCDV
jgi:hypothetical protein